MFDHKVNLGKNAILCIMKGLFDEEEARRYIKKFKQGVWTVNRVADPTIESVEWRFPDWCAILELPTLTVEDVMRAAVGEDLLPAGITRFLIPERALRLNIDLSLLGSARTQEEKQQSLDDLLEQRANEGRIRRYEETVFAIVDLDANRHMQFAIDIDIRHVTGKFFVPCRVDNLDM